MCGTLHSDLGSRSPLETTDPICNTLDLLILGLIVLGASLAVTSTTSKERLE